MYLFVMLLINETRIGMNSWDLLMQFIVNNLGHLSDASLDKLTHQIEVELRERKLKTAPVTPWPYGDSYE